MSPVIAPQQAISNDLLHHIVRDYSLTQASSMRLYAFRTLINKLPGIKKETAVPMFYILAAELHGQELTERLSVQVPALEKVVAMFDKLEHRLSLIPFRPSEYHLENIRALANGIIFDPTNYAFNDLPERVYTAVETKADTLSLKEAFDTPANAKILGQEISKICSSVKNGYRESIVRSIDTSSKGKVMSLAMCTYKLSEKYRGKGAVVETSSCIKVALLRRFSVENARHAAIMGDDAKKGKKTTSKDPPPPTASPTAATDSQSVPTEARAAAYGVRLLQNGMMLNHTLEMVKQPVLVSNANYWQLWDWHYQRLQIALGPKDSPKWKQYIEDIVAMDREMFPLEIGSAGLDRLDALLAPSSGSAMDFSPEPTPMDYGSVAL